MNHVRVKLFMVMAMVALIIPAAGYAASLVSNSGEEISVWELKGLAAGVDAIESSPFRGTGGVARLNKVGSESITEAMPYNEMMKLKAVKAPVGIETVLGFDGRVRTVPTTFPWKAVVLITFNAGRCTGFLVDPDVVLTAGHCVHSGKGGKWYTNHKIFPGKNAGASPYGSFRAKQVFTNTDWMAKSRDDRDWGIILLNGSPGLRTGFFGILTNAVNNEPIQITGYPGDKRDLSQWQSSDKVRINQATRIFYKADTLGGMSGSPAWHEYFLLKFNGPYAAGVHTYGTENGGAFNHATKIDTFFYNSIIAVKRM